jgi:hypothetical protein
MQFLTDIIPKQDNLTILILWARKSKIKKLDVLCGEVEVFLSSMDERKDKDYKS